MSYDAPSLEAREKYLHCMVGASARGPNRERNTVEALASQMVVADVERKPDALKPNKRRTNCSPTGDLIGRLHFMVPASAVS